MRRPCREGKRKACAPNDCGWEQRPRCTSEVELKVEPDVRRNRRVHGPERKRCVETICCPRDSTRAEQLAPRQHNPGARKGSTKKCAQSAADDQPRKEDSENDGKRVDGSSKHQSEVSCPDRLRAKRTESGQANGQGNASILLRS